MANISIQLHERLDGIQKHFGLFDHIPAPALEPQPENPTPIDPLHFESTILDGIPVRTRAGLFVYFNAAVSTTTAKRPISLIRQLCGRPLIDDHKIVSFLNARYAVSLASYLRKRMVRLLKFSRVTTIRCSTTSSLPISTSLLLSCWARSRNKL
jgi:hypothetical protein